MKISKRTIISYWIVVFLVMMERIFYLINVDSFRVMNVINYATLWFGLFVLFLLYHFIVYKLFKKKCSLYFGTDILGLVILTIIAMFECKSLTGQSLLQGFMPQRNYIFVLLSYFIIRKLYAFELVIPKKIKKGVVIVGIISVLLYSLQILLYNQVQFINVYQNSFQVRLYVDSVLCVIIGFIGIDRYLKTYRLRYLLLVGLTLLYEFAISKGRLETVAFLTSVIFGILLMKRGGVKRVIIFVAVVVMAVIFLNSGYADRFFEAINVFGSNDAGVNTMALRVSARASFAVQLSQSAKTMLFGCGYPNTSNVAASAMIGYNKNYSLVDNGIYAFIYVYGILGLVIFVKWFVKMFRCAWKCFKKFGDYIYILFMIFNTMLLYNITFWWHKPSWTFMMVIIMSIMEHKLYDYNQEME